MVSRLPSRVAMTLVLLLSSSALAADLTLGPPSLESGFRLMYDLEFDRAHQVISAWQQQHPEDPMGQVCEAARLLFSEFNRLGILESQFYENDKAFEGRKKLAPDAATRQRFDASLAQAEALATKRLASDPKNRDGLLAMTLSAGLKADYAALIEKRNLASLHLTKDATKWAQQLLAADPTCYDAYVATGISKYLIGSVSFPLRWVLKIGGFDGDKKAGMAELQLTADRGHYLAPFARILLAIAYVREKDKPRARQILASLRDEFPKNPLFPLEIARLDGQP